MPTLVGPIPWSVRASSHGRGAHFSPYLRRFIKFSSYCSLTFRHVVVGTILLQCTIRLVRHHSTFQPLYLKILVPAQHCVLFIVQCKEAALSLRCGIYDSSLLGKNTGTQRDQLEPPFMSSILIDSLDSKRRRVFLQLCKAWRL